MHEDAGEAVDGSDDGSALAHLLSTDIDTVRPLLPDPITRVDLPDDFLDGSATEWFSAGYPVLVMIGVNDYELRVGDPAVRWESQMPVLYARKVHDFIRPDRSSSTSALKAVEWQIRRTRRLRMRRFRRCRECARMTPPEWRDDVDLCQSCAERNHGVVH